MSKPYDVLGVDANAREAAIKAAFRRAAKTCHPDLNGGDREGERRLRRLIAAREYLLGRRRRMSSADARLGPVKLVTPRYKRTPVVAGALTAAGFLVFLLFLSGRPHSAEPAFSSFDSQVAEAGADEANIPDAGSAEIKAIRDSRELYSLSGDGGLRKPGQDMTFRKFVPKPVPKPHPNQKNAVSEAASQVSRTWRRFAWRLHGT